MNPEPIESMQAVVRMYADGTAYAVRGLVSGAPGSWALTYRDPGTDGSEIVLRFGGETVQMLRSGAYSTEMLFSAEQPYEGSYGTPFGTVAFRLRTERMRCEETDSGWHIELDYALCFSGSAWENHSMSIAVTV